MKLKALPTIALAAMALCACSSDNGNETANPPVTPPETNAPEIKISTNVASITDTRATDYAFEVNDKIGLFVVNRNADGSENQLKLTGNHTDNAEFTYNATWQPAAPVYWKDNTTHADFYLYYPYNSRISSVEAMPFSVAANQSSLAQYKASDLLIGSAKNVAPTEKAVGIGARHVMSQMAITLVAGNGFTEDKLAAANVAVRLNGLKTEALVNLATAAVTAQGTPAAMTPYKEGNTYKALIVPQATADGSLITVNVDGQDYNLKKAFTFVSGKRHKFVVTLSKTGSGINVGINPWEDDGTDNGGTAE